jgi:hypothetical protein
MSFHLASLIAACIVPVATLQAQQAAATGPLQQSLAALRLAYAAGDAIDMTNTLKTSP